MPVKRRVPKRRVAELPDVCFRFLADLPEPSDAGSDELIGFEYLDHPMSVQEAWARFGADAVVAHQRVHPNSMPPLWHHYGLPGDDGGGGDEAA
jgi:hypothetical protein